MAGLLIFILLLVFLLEGFNFVIIVGCYLLPVGLFIVKLSDAINRDKLTTNIKDEHNHLKDKLNNSLNNS